MRYTLVREQNRKAAISVGVRPAAHNSRTCKVSTQPRPAWRKWGPKDQFGALNYITLAKRAQAAALVREGASVSMSLPLATQPGPDNPTPVMHLMVQTGAPGEASMVPVPYSADYFAIAPHGL